MYTSRMAPIRAIIMSKVFSRRFIVAPSMNYPENIAYKHCLWYNFPLNRGGVSEKKNSTHNRLFGHSPCVCLLFYYEAIYIPRSPIYNQLFKCVVHNNKKRRL